MATLIKADGTIVKDIVLKGLEHKQELVGGWIETHFTRDKVFIFNEEGLLLSLPHNNKASEELGGDLVGDVIIASHDEIT
jgi:hypothetical protein|tara:strand:+ start:680 stop:919 length:240 start_codon:yes stop_codon:yes gene_type:complete